MLCINYVANDPLRLAHFVNSQQKKIGIMPYRRLPTTDKARRRALEAALKQASNVEDGKLVFSKYTLSELDLVKTNFENTLKQYNADINTQMEKNKEYRAAMEKAATYISHFIQVLFMTVERGEIKEETLEFYGLLGRNGKVPPLNTEQEILGWGNKIIEGEQKRIQKGGSPIYTPSIAVVKVKIEEFQDVAIFMQNLKRISARSYERMKAARKATNDFISKMWNEIEEHLENGSPKHKRQRSQEYGVVYVFRRREKKLLRSEDLQTDLLFDFR